MSFAQANTARTQAAQPPVSFGAASRAAGVEQRGQRRARANWASRLINAAGTVNTGRVCDVSEGGFGLLSPVNMSVGSMLEVALAVPMDKDGKRSVPVRCRVRVVFCAFVGAQSRLGVQFIALPMATRIAIRQYVLSHA